MSQLHFDPKNPKDIENHLGMSVDAEAELEKLVQEVELEISRQASQTPKENPSKGGNTTPQPQPTEYAAMPTTSIPLDSSPKTPTLQRPTSVWNYGVKASSSDPELLKSRSVSTTWVGPKKNTTSLSKTPSVIMGMKEADEETVMKIRSLEGTIKKLEADLSETLSQLEIAKHEKAIQQQEFSGKMKNLQVPCSEHPKIIEELHDRIAKLYLEDKSKDVVHQEELEKWKKKLKEQEEMAVELSTKNSKTLLQLEEMRGYTKVLIGALKENNVPIPTVGQSAPQPTTREASKSIVDQVPERATISVNCLGVVLNSVVNPQWTVAETIQRLARKFPGPADNFCLFIKNGKNSFQRLEEDKPLFIYKQLLQDPKISKIVLEFADPNGFERKGNNWLLKKTKEVAPTRVAPDKTDPEKLRKQLMEMDEEGQTPFHSAIRSNNPKAVALLLGYMKELNLDVNMKDKFGWTGLHIAVSNHSGTDSDDEILKMLFEQPGLNFDVENQDQNTPLHYFCQKFISPRCGELGEILIQHAPSSINKRNRNGETPLHKAIFNNSVRILMVNLLIKHGADVNMQNAIGGETALHYAVRLGRRDLVKVLLHSGADITIKDSREHKTPYELAISTKEKEIAEVMKSFIDLYDWLAKLNLKEFFHQFIKADLLLDSIAEVSDMMIESLLDSVGISQENQRNTIKQALPGLRDEIGKRIFEQKLKQVEKHAMPPIQLPSVAEITALKKSLSEIVSEGWMERDENWLINHSDLEFTRELGTGTYGNVFKGLFQGKKVAIKVLKEVDKTFDEFKKEFHIMSVVRSPYIVHFVGACLEPRLCMVLEYCSRGSLYDVLRNEKQEIGWDKALNFAIQMAAGMATLHTWDPPILHRDMKSLNLLVNKQWQLKVCDFGLARFNTAESLETMSKMCGTYAYLGPEMFHGGAFTEKTDVWAVGVILWEIARRVITGKYMIPYSEFKLKHEFQILYQVAEKGIRPTMPQICHPTWWNLVNQCMEKDAAKRPTMVEILKQLEDTQKEFLENPTKWKVQLE